MLPNGKDGGSDSVLRQWEQGLDSIENLLEFWLEKYLTPGSLVVFPHLKPQILPQFLRFVEPVIQNAELQFESLHSCAFDSVPNAQKLQFTNAVQFLCNSTYGVVKLQRQLRDGN